MPKITNDGITLPVALQCNRITYFSAHDTGIMGDPCDINSSAKFKGIIEKITYKKLLKTLTSRQYPNERSLPDCNGQFLLPPQYDTNNPMISISHCLISDHQKTALDQIDTFDHSKIVASKSSMYGKKGSESLQNHVVVTNDKKKVVDDSSTQNMGRGARKKTQTQFYTQSLQFTQQDDTDYKYASQTQTDLSNDDNDMKLSFFTQPGAELTQDYIHGLSDMLATQPVQAKDPLVGRAVRKFFKGYGWFDGIVSRRHDRHGYYEILYSDGDREGLEEKELKKYLVSDSPKDDNKSKKSEKDDPSYESVQNDDITNFDDYHQDIVDDSPKKVQNYKKSSILADRRLTRKDEAAANNVQNNKISTKADTTSENFQRNKTSSKANEVQGKSKGNNTSKTSSKDDTASQEIQSSKLVSKEDVKRKRRYESVKPSSESVKPSSEPVKPSSEAIKPSSSEPEEVQEIVVLKESSIKQDQVQKSKSQSVYSNPDFRKILNSLQTSKYIPCGYDKDGKITKSLRVIS